MAKPQDSSMETPWKSSEIILSNYFPSESAVSIVDVCMCAFFASLFPRRLVSLLLITFDCQNLAKQISEKLSSFRTKRLLSTA